MVGGTLHSKRPEPFFAPSPLSLSVAVYYYIFVHDNVEYISTLLIFGCCVCLLK